jgi:hypothetical protein
VTSLPPPWQGPTYFVASPEYVCSGCGFRHPCGRVNDMGTPEGAVVMLRHLQAAHGYKPGHEFPDWRERALTRTFRNRHRHPGFRRAARSWLPVIRRMRERRAGERGA